MYPSVNGKFLCLEEYKKNDARALDGRSAGRR